jgi:predicted RNase H-like nuclease (RuvC/YqgF family)
MNANLKGDVRIRGVPIKEFIEKIVSETTELKPVINDTKKDTNETDGLSVLKEKIQYLEAFQDEKKVLSDNIQDVSKQLIELNNKLTNLEKSFEEKAGEPGNGIKELKNNVHELENKLTNLDKAFEKKVGEPEDEAKEFDKKVKEIETKLTNMEKSLLEKLDKKVKELATEKYVEKKIGEIKPKRGVDQNSLDSAISEIKEDFDSKVKVVSNALAELRKELEE